MFPTCDLGSGPAGKSVRENHRIAVEKFHDQRQVPAHGIYRFAQSHGSIPRQFNTVIVRSSEVANQNNMVVMQERYARQQDFVDGVARLQGDFSPAPAGSGTVSGWTLTLMPMSGGQPADITSGTWQIVNGVLGTLDPTLMLNGTYDLVLTVVGSDGSQTQSTANISVEGNPKVGDFTLSFTDLDVPVAGVGRNNWGRLGTDEGGRWAVVLDSIIASCRQHSIDPFAYLNDVITKIGDACVAGQIAGLLSVAWATAQAVKTAARPTQPVAPLPAPAGIFAVV